MSDQGEKKEQGKTLWIGRYETEAAKSLRKLNDSLPFDKQLWPLDVACSDAYAKALETIGILSEAEGAAIDWGLDKISEELGKGEFVFAPGDEDIHTAVERRLGELIGPIAGKIHTGRSRNDQVATDVRGWLKLPLTKIRAMTRRFQEVVINQAKENVETLMPGYTHLRAAQPITAAHWLMSYFWMLKRDVKRFDVCRESIMISPLGSGALSLTPHPIH